MHPGVRCIRPRRSTRLAGMAARLYAVVTSVPPVGRTMRRSIVVFFALAWPLLPVTAAGVDIDALCLDCHRGGGAAAYQAPIIEGQQGNYLARQLTHFRERHRDSFPMSSVLAGMDDMQLDALAAALSRRDWPASTQRPASSSRIERGAALPVAGTCGRCHGGDLAGMVDAPRLAGQHRGYLQRQLRAMIAGERDHPAPLEHEPALTAGDVDGLAAWLHAAAPAGAAKPQ